MGTNQTYITETIAQMAAVAAKAVVQAMLAERGDEPTRHRSEEAGMRLKIVGPSPTFNFTKKVKSICQTHDIYKAESIQVLKTITRQASSHTGRAGRMQLDSQNPPIL